MAAMTRPRRRGWRWLLAVCLVAGCCGAAVAADGTLTIIPHADLKNIDPIWTTAYITRNHGYMVYDTLFSLDADLRPQPQMVDTWSVSDDGLVYTFTLRDGLAWHDGAPVRAADCVASIRRWGQRDGMGQKLLEFTADLSAVDDRTFTLALREPYGLVLESLGKLSSNVPFMMPERLAATDAFTQIAETIGSGPFIFLKDEWVPGSKVVYARNPHYVPRAEPPSFAAGGKRVHVERVEWLYIPDPATAQAALAAREVDYYERPPVDLLPLMERDPGLTVAVIDPLGTQGWLRPNHLHPPFDRKEARQALLWMVNQADYMRAIVGDPKFWRTCGSYFMCGTSLETDAASEALVQQDLERARQLMEAAGYAGETIVLMDPTDVPILHGASLVTAQMLKKDRRQRARAGHGLEHPDVATGGEERPRRRRLAPVSHLGDGRRRGLAGQQHRPVGGLRGESVVRLAVRRAPGAAARRLGARHRRRTAALHRRGAAARGLRQRAVRQLRPVVHAHRVQQVAAGRGGFAGAVLLEHREGGLGVTRR